MVPSSFLKAVPTIGLPRRFHLRLALLGLLIVAAGIFLASQSHPVQAASEAGQAAGHVSNPGITRPPAQGSVASATCTDPTMKARFMAQWNSMIVSSTGTVNPNGYLKVIGSDLIPYHSVETFMVEAPDQGHELSSETWSYFLWLTAEYGYQTGDFSYFNNVWAAINKYAIPSAADQPNGGYNPSSPATYGGEFIDPSSYPVPLVSSNPAGQDPFYAELNSTYGNSQVYGMHWLFDGDNFYKFGQHNDGTSVVDYINTFQRGPNESTWEVIPQPSWDTMKWGQLSGSTPQGFGVYFTQGAGAAKYSYTDAPDADARSVQATYRASQAAAAWGTSVSTDVSDAAKLGDYLRYAMAEKYFKAIPCASMSPSCPGGTGKNSLHYLISWYYAWGGDASSSHSWSWRIGDYAAHFGYQNPEAAWVLSTNASFKPLSPTGATDWGTSLSRQLDFYQWLQSAEGAIAGGAQFGAVSSSGSYTATTGPQFNGMTYVEEPVYLDPGSNTWFGFQAWSMQRLAEYYYNTGNAQAGAILKNWVAWVEGSAVKFVTGTNGEDVNAASTIGWSGAPSGNFTSGSGQPAANPGLHVSIVNFGTDMGTIASAADALTWYAAATGKYSTLDTTTRDFAKRMLDDQWNNHRTASGVTAPESRADYTRFDNQVVYFPAGTTGTTPACSNNCLIPGATFKQIRPQYASDPNYAMVEAANAAGTAPTFTYHRFWAQTDVAVANAFWGDLFGSCGTVTPTPVVSNTPTKTNTPVTPTKTNTPTPTGSIAPTKTNTPTNTPVTPTKTNTPTNGPSLTPTKTFTFTPTFVATTPVKTNTPTATSGSGVTCSPVTATIAAPFTFDGAATNCWKTNSLASYINSWNLTKLTVNGVDYTNKYIFVSAFPAKASDGYWYISYVSTVAWGHFEAK